MRSHSLRHGSLILIVSMAMAGCLLVFSGAPWQDVTPTPIPTAAASVGAAFLDTFNSPDCDNACWHGIEIGAADFETATAILDALGMIYEIRGSALNGRSILVTDIPGGLFPEVARDAFLTAGIFLNAQDTVYLIQFPVDLCVATVISVYGEPGVWQEQPIGGGPANGLSYPARDISFGMPDLTSPRVNRISLHDGAIDGPDMLLDWSMFADGLEGDCNDIFSTID